MDEKKTLIEIIDERLTGRWCDGIAIIDISADAMSVDNIYSNNGKQIFLDKYPISLNKKVFSKVIETDYDKALLKFNNDNKAIISPKVLSDEVITFDGCKSFELGGNVYEHTQEGKIIVNDKHRFDDFNEIREFNFISEKEKNGIWLVF